MDIEKKEKAKKIGLRIWLGISTALSLMFVVFVAIACSNVNSNKEANAESEVIEFHQNNKLNAVYDDDNNAISLTADELHYSFENFYNVLVSSGFADDITFTLGINGSTYQCSYDTQNSINGDFVYTVESYYVYFGISYDYVFYDEGESLYLYELPNFESFTINCFAVDTNIYEDFKSEIELDIQANNVQPFVPSIFTALTNSISGFIGTLGVGIVAITSIFWANNALTTIGLLSVIVVAVSIAYWLFRLIIGLIRMRG